MSQPATEPATRRRGPRRRWIILTAVVALIGLGVGAWWFWLRPAPTSQAATRTFTATAESATRTQTVSLSGTLSPRTSAALTFDVSGTVTTVYVEAGDSVKKGEKLARIDDTALRNAATLAEANLDAAEATLDDISDSGTTAAVKAARARVDSAEASLASAQDDLEQAVLRSPITGTVASLDLAVGDSTGGSSSSGGQSTTGTTQSSAQIVVISTQTWKVEGSVGSADLAALKAGQSAAITVDGASEALEGTVASVGIVATSSSDGSATFPVVLSVSGKHPDLYSGTTATAVVTTGEFPDVLTVPTQAITTTADGKAVVQKVVGSGTEETEVELGTVFGDATQITSGLSVGDEVQISITMPQRSSDADSQGSGGLFGGGMSGGGGGAPPAGGGAPGGGAPGGGQGGGR